MIRVSPAQILLPISNAHTSGFNPCPAGYSYYAPISVHQPSSTLTDFPILIGGVADYKTAGNGGKVQNTETISVPYSHAVPADFVVVDSDATTLLKFEFEFYAAATGTNTRLWVKVPSDTTSAKTIYTCFGNASVTTFQGDVNGTWNSAYVLVAHYYDGSTLGLKDSTSNANDGTNHSATASAGKIDGDATFVAASTQYIDHGTGSSLGITVNITVSAWIKLASSPTLTFDYIAVAKDADTGGRAYTMDVQNTVGGNVGRFYIAGGGSISTGSTALSTGTYYNLAGTYESGVGSIVYIDGVSDGTGGDNGDIPTATTGLTVGRRNFVGFLDYFDGHIDEVRISNVVRAADWLLEETYYGNNPLTPGATVSL